MKRAIGIILFTVIIVNMVYFTVYFLGNNPSNEQANPQDNNSLNQTGPVLTNNSGVSNNNPKISVSELSTHNSKSDCWVAYKGKVYDLTSFLPAHPGSAGAIIPYCGTSEQFERAFTNQHGTSQVKALIREGIYKGDLQ